MQQKNAGTCFNEKFMSKFSNFNFNGHKALIRADFNVPLDANYQITDDNRMKATIPTIQKILKAGGSVILMSHLGRPKEGPSEKYSRVAGVDRKEPQVVEVAYIRPDNQSQARRRPYQRHRPISEGHHDAPEQRYQTCLLVRQAVGPGIPHLFQ